MERTPEVPTAGRVQPVFPHGGRELGILRVAARREREVPRVLPPAGPGQRQLAISAIACEFLLVFLSWRSFIFFKVVFLVLSLTELSEVATQAGVETLAPNSLSLRKSLKYPSGIV